MRIRNNIWRGQRRSSLLRSATRPGSQHRSIGRGESNVLPHTQKRSAAFTLVEAVVAFLILAIVIVSFYAALSFGFTTIRLAQENVRADQILMQKMETIRVYHWSKVFTPGYLPQSFTNSYSGSRGSNLYTGTISVGNFPVSAANESYADGLRQVTVTLNWISGGVTRTRSISSFVSQYGLQTYRN